MFLFWVWKDGVSPKLCDFLLDGYDFSHSEEGRICKEENKGIDSNIRVSNVLWDTDRSPISCIAQTFVGKANKEAGWNYAYDSFEEVQLGKYENGGHYDWHMDINYRDVDTQRKLSCVILLNDPETFEGGNLEFESADVQPTLKKGSIIVFPSFIRHRVTPVTKGIRYSSALWARGPMFK